MARQLSDAALEQGDSIGVTSSRLADLRGDVQLLGGSGCRPRRTDHIVRGECMIALPGRNVTEALQCVAVVRRNRQNVLQQLGGIV
jgi:hypothetical protein